MQLYVSGGRLTGNLFSLRTRDSHLGQNVIRQITNAPAKWHLNPSHGLSKGHECDRRQTTDKPRYIEMCWKRWNR